ncbi:MAG: Do family serine endopeptidase [Balneola sp.]
MNTTVRNIFGVAAAMILLLGMNAWTGNNSNRSLPEYTTDNSVTSAENRPVSSLLDLNNAIVDIAEKTNPAVVMITTEKVQEQRIIRNPFSQFFGNPNSQQDPETREYTQRGLGSGVIVSENGYILTNNHVIENVDEIKVQLFNGDEVEAELIGTDPATDIAVVKVDMDNLPAVKIGDSETLKVGAFVLAIGSPLSQNLAHTVSFGIVSAKSRSIGLIDSGAGFEDFIQTDAAINPGNSGGAMIDMNGELVGINSAIASRSGGNDGIGFAIPINLAKRIMDDLIDDGKVSRGYLGILPAEVDQTMAKALDLEEGTRGVLISQVVEGSAADEAGLKVQDVIVSIDGEKLTNGALAFRTKVSSFMPGDKVEFTVIRDGEEKEVSVTLGKRPDDLTSNNPGTKKAETMEEKLGFTVSELDATIRRQLELDGSDEGVVVNRIKESSNAFERGLRRGDVITSVKNKKVETSSEFYDELEKLQKKGDEVVLLKIIRGNGNQFIAFELE